ncbi:uncharacterized protein I303_107796 [Kwoniella dejecticola CBS 10117]|uniref:C-CAP/cofactor C-like domain-containing protein n=1 Tax=Kwoniella dejecticola CBS 10117 TaxID=1296121 RepID=A0AAJ8ML81_9TREE
MSTSNGNSKISTSQAAEFHAYFTKQREEIDSLVVVSGTQGSSDTNELSQRINALRTEVDKISSLIPVYDRVKYEKSLVELENRLSSLKAKDKPKSKFSFKSRPKSTPSAAASTSTSASTSSSSVPRPEAGPYDLSASVNQDQSNSGASTPTKAGSASTPAATPRSGSSNSHTHTHTIAHLSNRPIRPPEGVKGNYTLNLSNLRDCIIDLRPLAALTPLTPHNRPSTIPNDNEAPAEITAIHGKSLERCLLITPLMRGSALLDEVKDSVLALGCQQFRIHTSTNNTILLNVNSLPVIEHCKTLRFGGYPEDLLQSRSTDRTNNLPHTQSNANTNHTKVQDFDWPLPTPSPNWSVLSETDAAQQSINILEILDRMQILSDNSEESSNVAQILDKVLPPSS